ncbi:MAG: two-component system response regulator [Candidatus Cloacimonetes bacterium HGW-Cloacimonetes-1]|jgi:response regulator RpfG family c-di-GMP phosphodiesterase|nr:MAG: two-component system response regulator [Candidatus Cloacimonetes bacterium HGW-Cloacimonetes-1]
MSDKIINILVVDDDEAILRIISRILIAVPNYRVYCCSDSLEALTHLQTKPINVMISDIVMPKLSGLELLKKVANIDSKISVILITGTQDSYKMRTAIQLNAFDFLRKPFDLAELEISVKQAIEKNALLIENENYQNNLELLVQQRTLELFDAKSKLERSYLNTIGAMVNAIEANDIYTKGHSERVTILSLLLGKKMRLSSEELKQLRVGSLLHDIGKIGILTQILSKPDTLTESEYELVKMHPTIGDKIIAPVGLPRSVHQIILQHHEWVNGKGYPHNLKGEDISLLSKIVSVADSFDAMTSQRVYRTDLDIKTAFEEIEQMSGIQFDDDIVRIFCSDQEYFTASIYNPDVTKEMLFGRI